MTIRYLISLGICEISADLLQERLTAQEAMAHAYFAPVRANEAQAAAGNSSHS